MSEAESNSRGRVTGSGIFSKSADPRAATEWYTKHLGIPTGPGGCQFPMPSADRLTVWATFPANTK